MVWLFVAILACAHAKKEENFADYVGVKINRDKSIINFGRACNLGLW